MINCETQPEVYTDFFLCNTNSIVLRQQFFYIETIKHKEDSSMAFSQNLIFLRGRSHLTQEQLAEQLNVSRQSVSKWESGLSFPEMDTILKLCDLFAVSLDTLLRGDAEQEVLADTAGYDRFMNRFSWKISLPIGGIILGGALMPILSVFGVPKELCGAVLLLIITAAVVVLVASGIQYENFRKRHPVIPDFYSQKEKETFHDRMVFYVSGAIGTILLGVALTVLAFSFLPEQEPYESCVAGSFLAIIAVSVTVLVWAGMREEKYKIDKYNRNNQKEFFPSEEDKRRDQRAGRICGVIMLLATAAYVGLGLSLDLWYKVWWLFPVGGILCGVVYVAIGPAEEE